MYLVFNMYHTRIKYYKYDINISSKNINYNVMITAINNFIITISTVLNQN